jgi:protein associated with RNAse G/E
VEFVALERSAFAEIMADTGADIRVFEKGTAQRLDMAAEFSKHRKQFDLDQFGVNVP